MVTKGAQIIYDESGATKDSNILDVAIESSSHLILGNSILYKYDKEEYFEKEKFSISDKFVNSLLDRIELIHSRRLRM